MLKEFRNFYAEGQVGAAFQKVFKGPATCLEGCQGGEESDKLLLDYADSLVFGNPSTALEANLVLRNSHNPSDLSDILGLHAQMLEMYLRMAHGRNVNVSDELKGFKEVYAIELQGGDLSAALERKLLRACPSILAESLSWQADWARRINAFRRRRPHVWRACAMAWRPPFALAYAAGDVQIARAGGQTPVFFMEPYELDWKTTLAPWQGRPALFVFYDESVLWHCLQFEAVCRSLCDPAHFVCLTTRYFNRQALLQECAPLRGLCGLDCGLHPLARESAPELLRLLEECFKNMPGQSWQESRSANALYRLGRRLAWDVSASRLGKGRACACAQLANADIWWDARLEGLPARQVPLGSPLECGARRPRPMGRGCRLRVAHIVQRLTDSGYAPTRRLTGLVESYDRSVFEVMVVSTEQNVYRPREYPYYFDMGESSLERGRETLARLRRHGVRAVVDDGSRDMRGTARFLAGVLSEAEVDMAIFHDDAVIHTLLASLCDVPARIFYVHGKLPTQPVYDYAIVGFEEERARCRRYFDDLGIRIYVNPPAVDIRSAWGRRAFTKEDFGLGADRQILTTVSNMLDVRLSVPFCEAVAAILRRCPQAVYMPVGDIDDKERLYAIFDFFDVGERVFFLGRKQTPSFYLQAMDIYLNEFPVGGGLAALDAMAAGLPIVTMYDGAGTYKSREAGNYFGPDLSVRSCLPADYVALSLELLGDAAKRRLYGSAARQRYESFCQVEAMGARHHGILLDIRDRALGLKK